MKLLGQILAPVLQALGQEYVNYNGGNPQFRGPTPARRRARAPGASYLQPYRRETPKPPSKRDLHRAAVAAKKAGAQ